MNGDADFKVGLPVEITNDEAMDLRAHADVMHGAALHRKRGWFRAYLVHHREAHKIIQTIFRRSHASPGIQREEGPH